MTDRKVLTRVVGHRDPHYPGEAKSRREIHELIDPTAWLTRPPEERRDYNADERAMIERGDRAGAKVAWHKRTKR